MSGLSSAKRRRSLLSKFGKIDASLERQLDPIGKRIIQIRERFFSRSAGGQKPWETRDASGIALRTEACHDRKLHRMSTIAGQTVHEQSISKKDTPFKALCWRRDEFIPIKVSDGRWS
jgi:hypothetical protein